MPLRTSPDNPGLRRGLRTSLPVLLALLSTALPHGAMAQSHQAVSLSADNDGFVFWTPPHERPDRYYTNGLKIRTTVGWNTPWAGLLSSGSTEPCRSDGPPGRCARTVLEFGQKIFTPNFIFDEDPETDDRPFAGWLFVAANSIRVEENTRTSLGVEMGVTGAPSLAGPLHRWFHRSLNKHEPLGWENQLPFEPAILLRFSRSGAFSRAQTQGPLSFAVEPRFGANLGTLRTSAWTGLFLHAGWNGPLAGEWREEGSDGFFLRVAVGTEAEMVARDLFLDGSTWQESVHANRRVLVGRLRGQLQLGWGRVGVEFRSTHSTLEFKGQDGGHTYGTLRLLILS